MSRRQRPGSDPVGPMLHGDSEEDLEVCGGEVAEGSKVNPKVPNLEGARSPRHLNFI